MNNCQLQLANLAGYGCLTTRIAAFSLPHLFLVATAFAADATAEQGSGFLSNWLDNVTRTQELQPHWESLLGMSSPRLTQGFRYGYGQQYLHDGSILTNNGMGKGVELIVGENCEVQIGVPAYMDKQGTKTASSGWADETFLGRYRFLAANEENGNYIISGSLGLSIPTGNAQFSSHSTVLTPTLAAGKGWGTRQHGFNMQSSLSMSVPDHNQSTMGMPISWSTALQGHITQEFWPEIDASYSHWFKGVNDGKNQLVLTYGMVFGHFGIKSREKLTFGIGYQEPIGTKFSTYTRGWISTLKLSF
jgi:hypothetical protein